MQKARRHPIGLRPLVGVWFQVLFTLLLAVLFTFPSRYWFTIGLSGVFSLTRWCWHVHAKFHRLRATLRSFSPSCTGLSPSADRLSSAIPLDYFIRTGLFRFRSPLLTESFSQFLFLRVLRCFSSPRYCLSTSDLQSDRFPHSDISGSQHICG